MGLMKVVNNKENIIIIQPFLIYSRQNTRAIHIHSVIVNTSFPSVTDENHQERLSWAGLE
jgi:hypothetical protein